MPFRFHLNANSMRLPMSPVECNPKPFTRFRRFCSSSNALLVLPQPFCKLFELAKSLRPLSMFNLSCISWRSLSDSVPLSRSGSCGEFVWLVDSKLRNCVVGVLSSLKKGDGWNVFDEKKLLLSSYSASLVKRVAVSMSLLFMLLVSGWQFVLISALLTAVPKFSNEFFSKLALFCCLSTSCWVCVCPFSFVWSEKLAGELLPLTLSLIVPLSPLVDKLSDGVSALPSMSFDDASFSISDSRFSSSSALIVCLGDSPVLLSLVLKPASLPFTDDVPLSLLFTLVMLPVLLAPFVLLELLLLPFEFVDADFLFLFFSAFDFFPPFSLLLFLPALPFVSLFVGEMDRLGQASLPFSGPFWVCVPSVGVCLLLSLSFPLGDGGVVLLLLLLFVVFVVLFAAAAAVAAMRASCSRFSYSWCLPLCISSFVKLASRSPSSCRYMQSGLGHDWFFMKWLQYFVVPRLVFISRPSIIMLFTLWIARSASLFEQYVTYADADGPWTPAYVVLGFITTLWIFPYLPKYSCFLRIYRKQKRKGHRMEQENGQFMCQRAVNTRWNQQLLVALTSASASLGGRPTTNTKFFWTTLTFAKCLRFSEIFCFRCWSRWRFSAFRAEIYDKKIKISKFIRIKILLCSWGIDVFTKC